MTIEIRKCKRCGHEWAGRKARSRVCPKCHSPYWDIDRENGEVKDQSG